MWNLSRNHIEWDLILGVIRSWCCRCLKVEELDDSLRFFGLNLLIALCFILLSVSDVWLSERCMVLFVCLKRIFLNHWISEMFTVGLLHFILGFFLSCDQIAFPLWNSRQSSVFSFSSQSEMLTKLAKIFIFHSKFPKPILKLLLGLIRCLFRQHLTLPVGNYVAKVVSIWNLKKSPRENTLNSLQNCRDVDT